MNIKPLTLFTTSLILVSTTSVFAAEDSAKKNIFYNLNIGMAKISFDDSTLDDQNALLVSSKVGLRFNNNVSVYLGSEEAIYTLDSHHYASSLLGPGVDYTFPFAGNKLSVGVLGGLGINIDYSNLMSDFSDSLEFGSGVSAHIGYQLNKNWNAELSATQYHVDDNDSSTIGLSIGYDIGGAFISQMF